MKFIVITADYPPDHGGVSDYAFQVVNGLANLGSDVEVIVFGDRNVQHPPGLKVRRVGRPWNPISFWRATNILRSFTNSVILLQYVPQMYGLKGMNIGFVWWLSRWKRNPIWVMFHEVYVSAVPGALLKHQALAAVTQQMAKRLVARADRCFASIPGFVRLIDQLKPGVQAEWIPIPSNVATFSDGERVQELRTVLKQGNNVLLIGHFGTHGGSIRQLIQDVVTRAAKLHCNWRFVMIGRGSLEFVASREIQRIIGPGRVIASGELSSEIAACWIQACDLMLQPYPDGASSRRGSLMAGLALGKAIVSNTGHLCDLDSQPCEGLYLAEHPEAELLVAGLELVLGQDLLRRRLETEARALYRRRFSLEKGLQRLVSAQCKNDR